MAGTYLDLISNALKINYSGNKILEMFDKDDVLADAFKKRVTGFDAKGLYFYEIYQKTRPQGFAFVSGERSQIPTAGYSAYEDWQVSVKHLLGSFKIYGFAAKTATGNDKGSIINATVRDFQGVAKEAMYFLGLMLRGDGSGKLAEIASASNTDGTYALLTISDGETMAGIREGMYIDIYRDGSLVTYGSKHLVTAVNSATTFTIARADVNAATFTAATIAAGDIVVRYGEYGIVPVGLGVRGIGDPATYSAILDNTGTFQEIVRASTLAFQAIRIDGSDLTRFPDGADVDAAHLDALVDDIKATGLINKVDCFVMTLAARRNYCNEASASRRFIGDMTLDNGTRCKTHDEIPIIADNKWQPGFIAGLNWTNLFRCYVGDEAISWEDFGTGATFQRSADGTNSKEAVLSFDGNFGSRAPRHNGVLYSMNQ